MKTKKSNFKKLSILFLKFLANNSTLLIMKHENHYKQLRENKYNFKKTKNQESNEYQICLGFLFLIF